MKLNQSDLHAIELGIYALLAGVAILGFIWFTSAMVVKHRDYQKKHTPPPVLSFEPDSCKIEVDTLLLFVPDECTPVDSVALSRV